MEIREVMTKDVTLADPGMKLNEAAALMRDGDFGLLPVGENDRLIGTITDRDITIRAVAEGKDPNATTVREAMSEGIHYCFDDQSVEEAAELMSEAQIRRVPIFNATSGWSASWRSPTSPPSPRLASQLVKRWRAFRRKNDVVMLGA